MIEANKYSYKKVFDACLKKSKELSIEFDFDNNEHIQENNSMDEIFKNMVYHSQNRSQGCAVNFFEKTTFSNKVWEIIEKYSFNNDKLDYLNLFNEFKNDKDINEKFNLSSGKDIQFLELAKTCQCIKKYLSKYKTVDDFIDSNKFNNDYTNNMKKINNASKMIYNMGNTLICDFFKEQRKIIGRDFIIKPDVHVKRFFQMFSGSDLNDNNVYKYMLTLYNSETDEEYKKNNTPYKLDKYIYLIGVNLADPKKSKEFVETIKNNAKI